MPMKPYFHGRVEEATTKHGTFVPGDEVRVLPARPQWPEREGKILRLTRGNHGKGRIYAVVKVGNREDNVPIGACRHK